MTQAEYRLIAAALEYRAAQLALDALPCRGIEESNVAYYTRTSPARQRFYHVEASLRLMTCRVETERAADFWSYEI